LQVTKLLDTISRVAGALTPALFSAYRFLPVKAYPLIVKPVSQLGADFVALMRQYQKLKAVGQPIPRTVFITPTSKMRVFVKLLEAFGLLGDAHVVSRQESTPEAIEEARTSTKPILFSSPMFALGLNFESQPERMWTYFSYLKVDTSQVIQTLNRANRGATQCEVRLYCGELDSKPIQIPPVVAVRAKIEGYLIDESSVQGVLDSHFHIDRPTYNSLRLAEKQTSKALGYLIDGDRIQNYRIQRYLVEVLEVGKDDAEVYKSLKGDAKESYLDDIVDQAEHNCDETKAMLLHKLALLSEEDRKLDMSNSDRVIRDLEAEERGIVMVLCDIDDPEDAAKVVPQRIRRLFGELRPYLTAQFSADKTGAWRDASAEKTLGMIPLLESLKAMKVGQLDGNEFAIALRKTLRPSVKALADTEANLLQVWQPKLERLDKISELIRTKASDAQKAQLKAVAFYVFDGVEYWPHAPSAIELKNRLGLACYIG
jgi:hypothetical protein